MGIRSTAARSPALVYTMVRVQWLWVFDFWGELFIGVTRLVCIFRLGAKNEGWAADGAATRDSPPDCRSPMFEPLPAEQKITEPCWALLFFGAGDEARTRYLHLGKVALYQMSYTRKYGASGRSRTNDTRIFSPLLYLLSYRGMSSGICIPLGCERYLRWRPGTDSNRRPPA